MKNYFKVIIKKVYSILVKRDEKSLLLKRLKKQIKKRPLKIVVGAGGIFEEGWIETDINSLNVLEIKDWKNLFKIKKIDIILAEHVWEHLTVSDGKLALSNCYKFLKNGGHIRIAVPDGFNPNPAYIDYVKSGGHGAGADDHKILYNYKLLKNCLEESGFRVNLLEYFDEEGKFHFNEWATNEGMIRRSKRFDERNKNGLLNYTSLIMDGVK
jgi:predicted SAM-dependent methyltransferase